MPKWAPCLRPGPNAGDALVENSPRGQPETNIDCVFESDTLALDAGCFPVHG
jgi:hypothetical protein